MFPDAFAKQVYGKMRLLPLVLLAVSAVAVSTSGHHRWVRDVEPTDDEIRCEIGRDSCIGHAVNGHVSGGMATCTRDYSNATQETKLYLCQ